MNPFLQSEQVAQLKKEFHFDQWCGRKSLEDNLFIWKYFLAGHECPGWRIGLNQVASAPGIPRFIQSTWSKPDAETNIILRLDAYECESRLAAHELLIGLLSQFQIADAVEKEPADIGDVSFVVPNNLAILFASGNLAISVASAGTNPIDLHSVVESFNSDLCQRPARSVSPVRLMGESTSARGGPAEASHRVNHVGECIPLFPTSAPDLELEASASHDAEFRAEPEACFKIFAKDGEIILEGDQPVFRADRVGKYVVDIYEYNAEQTVSSSEFAFDVQ